MPLARIRTNFPDQVQEICEVLIEAGYTVETVRPDEVRILPADLEFVIDQMPVVEAWRNIPNVDSVYVAPGTPESRDIRTSSGKRFSYGPMIVNAKKNVRQFGAEFAVWSSRQWRSAQQHGARFRAKGSELRQLLLETQKRWTPPREYQAPPHLEPSVPPQSPAHIDLAIERAKREQEERTLRRQAEDREMARQAELAAESRRRAKEAAEARALLEEQQKIEAMVRATAKLREQMVQPDSPKPRELARRVPRRLLRTQRDRASFRAGVTAFGLAVGLSFLAAGALHPRPAARAIPLANASRPMANPANAVSAGLSPIQTAPSAVPAFAKDDLPAEAQNGTLKTLATRQDDFQDVVIIHKPAVAHVRTPKVSKGVVHYSDLD